MSHLRTYVHIWNLLKILGLLCYSSMFTINTYTSIWQEINNQFVLLLDNALLFNTIIVFSTNTADGKILYGNLINYPISLIFRIFVSNFYCANSSQWSIAQKSFDTHRIILKKSTHNDYIIWTENLHVLRWRFNCLYRHRRVTNPDQILSKSC